MNGRAACRAASPSTTRGHPNAGPRRWGPSCPSPAIRRQPMRRLDLPPTRPTRSPSCPSCARRRHGHRSARYGRILRPSRRRTSSSRRPTKKSLGRPWGSSSRSIHRSAARATNVLRCRAVHRRRTHRSSGFPRSKGRPGRGLSRRARRAKRLLRSGQRRRRGTPFLVKDSHKYRGSGLSRG